MFELIRDRVTEIQLAGETYQLIFDMNALAALEEEGVELENLDATRTNFSLVRLMVWAGMRTHHPEMTLADVGARIMPMDLARINSVLQQAIQSSFGQLPKAEEGGGEEGPIPTWSPPTTSVADS